MTLIKETEAAEYLGLSPKTLRKWRYRGMIDIYGTLPPPAYKRGVSIWYDLDELDNWVRGGMVRDSWR